MKLDIESLAKEAGFIVVDSEAVFSPVEEDEISAQLTRFAELVEAVTREDDALTCEAIELSEWGYVPEHGYTAAIRALK